MTITLELLEKNFTNILDKTGTESYVPWEQFTKTSTHVVNAIDGLTKWLAVFRQMQHKNFIQTMKRLKSLDIPDSIQSVRKKKLPKQVLKPIIQRFRLQGDNLELIDTKEQLKENALKQYHLYKKDNEELVTELQKYIEYLSLKAISSGYKQSEVSLPQINQFKSSMDFKLDDQVFKTAAKQITVHNLGNTKMIDLNTYSQLIEKSFDCLKDVYTSLVKQSRSQQRKNLSNHKVYFKLINDYLNNSQSLILQCEKKLYISLGFDGTQWEQNQEALLEKGSGQAMMMAQGGLREKIKKSIPSTKDVPVDEAVKVIRYQIQMIKQKGNDIKSILTQMPKGIQSAQIVPVLLSIILNDYIYEAFGYEEEDFMQNMNGPELYSNPQLAQCFGQMEYEIVRLMQGLGIIPQDISNMMMPQSQDMARMMAQMNGMMGNNGSQNPMDMLQMQQQMAQFQQMFLNQQAQQKKQKK